MCGSCAGMIIIRQIGGKIFICPFSTTNILSCRNCGVKHYIAQLHIFSISLAPEIMERALVAERRALVLVLPFHAVGVYIAVNRERNAILDPRLTEHLFCYQHFRNFAAVVFASGKNVIEICHAAKHLRAHCDHCDLIRVRRLETQSHTRATACAVKFGQCLQFVGVHITQTKRPHIARISERENIVMSSGGVRVTFRHVHVHCRVFHVVPAFVFVPYRNNYKAVNSLIQVSPHNHHKYFLCINCGDCVCVRLDKS